MRRTTPILASLFVAVGLLASGQASAKAACHDASGKFTKCAATPAATATRCKDASGKFAKCSAAGAVPMKTAAAKPAATATPAKPK